MPPRPVRLSQCRQNQSSPKPERSGNPLGRAALLTSLSRRLTENASTRAIAAIGFAARIRDAVEDAVKSGDVDAARKAKVISSGDKDRCSPVPRDAG